MPATKSPKVADFSTHWSGPVASRQLVQLGADVIKIENPRHGDGNRFIPVFDAQGEGLSHLYLNVGTRSLTADPHSEGWADLVAAVARWADVVIVGNRPSSARRLGLDFASLLEHNADLVYCLITGYGLDGPWTSFPAHGLNMDSLAGSVPVDEESGWPNPPRMFRSVGTTLAGIEASVGIYAALHKRACGDGAQFVHVSIWESALAWMWRDLITHASLGRDWDEYRDFGSRYCMYRTGDDGVILVCPTEEHFWARFCEVLGLPGELRERGDWALGLDYGEHYVALGEREVIQEHLSSKDRDEWVELLTAADVPVAPVLDWREVMESDHAERNGVMAEYPYNGRVVRTPTTPVSVTARSQLDRPDTESVAPHHREKGRDLTSPPALGQDTEAILTELGVPGLGTRLGAKHADTH